MNDTFELGIDTFGDITAAADGRLHSGGTLPHDLLMRSIELLGAKVAPRVRELLHERTTVSGGNR